VVLIAHLFILQIHASTFGTDWQGEILWHRESFHRLGVQDVTEFDSYAYWEKIKKEKWPGVFFPKAGHILLAVLHGIFMAVRSN
jgi:hypothetical protein